jgi:hypothetical protein
MQFGLTGAILPGDSACFMMMHSGKRPRANKLESSSPPAIR